MAAMEDMAEEVLAAMEAVMAEEVLAAMAVVMEEEVSAVMEVMVVEAFMVKWFQSFELIIRQNLNKMYKFVLILIKISITKNFNFIDRTFKILNKL